jgi:hypothetical protein
MGNAMATFGAIHVSLPVASRYSNADFSSTSSAVLVESTWNGEAFATCAPAPISATAQAASRAGNLLDRRIVIIGLLVTGRTSFAPKRYAALPDGHPPVRVSSVSAAVVQAQAP